MMTITRPSVVELPAPRIGLAVSVEEAIRLRRSVRLFANESLSLIELSQILWSAQGITDSEGHRAAPSAGEVYPLEIDVAVGRVTELEPGLYRYDPRAHALHPRVRGDLGPELTALSHEQGCVAEAAAILVVVAVEAKMVAKYGPESAALYVALEAGCVLQNGALQAVALGLGSVIVAAFRPAALHRVLELGPGENALALLAVGRPW